MDEDRRTVIYREIAKEADRKAQKTSDHTLKQALVQIATNYRQLADCHKWPEGPANYSAARGGSISSHTSQMMTCLAPGSRPSST
jgi:hypothetical protein